MQASIEKALIRGNHGYFSRGTFGYSLDCGRFVWVHFKLQQKQIRRFAHCTEERASFCVMMKINASWKSQGHHLWCREPMSSEWQMWCNCVISRTEIATNCGWTTLDLLRRKPLRIKRKLKLNEVFDHAQKPYQSLGQIIACVYMIGLCRISIIVTTFIFATYFNRKSQKSYYWHLSMGECDIACRDYDAITGPLLGRLSHGGHHKRWLFFFPSFALSLCFIVVLLILPCMPFYFTLTLLWLARLVWSGARFL